MKQKKGNPPGIKAMTWFTSQIAVFIFFFSFNQHAEALILPQTNGFWVLRSPVLVHKRKRQHYVPAALVTTKAYPHPELEVDGGSSIGSGPSAISGFNGNSVPEQRLNLPYFRTERRKVSMGGAGLAGESREDVRLAELHRIRPTFKDIRQRQAGFQATLDNQALRDRMRYKGRIMVAIGESPRYEQVKSEALIAHKPCHSTETRVQNDKAASFKIPEAALPYKFNVRYGLPPPHATFPPLEAMQVTVWDRRQDAASVLKITEAAYRSVQRGIFDYLDTQRNYLSVRNDYLGVRFDRQTAWVDIRRPHATSLEKF